MIRTKATTPSGRNAGRLVPAPRRDAARVFPTGFLWGAATAAYQIEGAAGGRGTSIWDTFSRTPGRVLEGATGDVACDHYHRWAEDLDLASWLGLGGYRFSVSWARWQPTGAGPADQRAVAFYDRLVDGLLERGIEPWATLYHWDLPQPLEDQGGWPARDVALRFAEYAASVGERLGDRLAGIATLNEPWCSAFLGYAGGIHAPGVQDAAAGVRAAHHLLLGHGLAVEALRAQEHDVPLGLSLNVYPVEPLVDRPEDHEAVRRIDGMMNRIFLDPLLRGAYPEDVVADLAGVTDLAHVRPGDLELISAPLDYLGENYYNVHVVTAPGTPEARAAQQAYERSPSAGLWSGAPDGWAPVTPWVGASAEVVFARRGLPETDMEWEIDPSGLTRVLRRLTDEYDCPPLYVTENGSAFRDTVVDGAVDDPQRRDYLVGHLGACLDAIDAGVDLRGYFLWTLLDNFEWAWGYERRFGVVHVDFATQQRTPKASAHCYRGVVGTNELPAQ